MPKKDKAYKLKNGQDSTLGTTHPKGSNPEDCWEIPEELLLKPLKSSCPRYVCKKCGKPKIKILEPTDEYKKYLGQGNLKEHHAGQETKTKFKVKVNSEYRVIGYTGCNCNAGFDGGVVLDPFAGRGTTGKVAKSLGLHYILFDIKPEYCELARLYIGGQKHKVPKGQSSLDSFGGG